MRPLPELAALALAAPLLVSAPAGARVECDALKVQERTLHEVFDWPRRCDPYPPPEVISSEVVFLWEEEEQADVCPILQARAERGEAEAQRLLGSMYRFYSKGLPQNNAKAAHWLRKAAEQGDTVSQVQLGLMYDLWRHSEGVPLDYAKAVYWYRKAAEQGDACGQYHLGGKYALGRGVPEDDVAAYAWLSLAEAAGIEPAVRFRTLLHMLMTPEQVSEAQVLSRDLAAMLPE